MTNEEKLTVRVKPKQAVQVNKPVIIAVLAVVLFVVLWSVLAAFTTTKQTKTVATIKASTEKPTSVSSNLAGLPESYSDVNAIQKYSSGLQSGALTTLQRQLEELRSEHAMLQEQLRAMNQRGPSKPPEDPQAQQAKSSSLVFSGLSSGVEGLVGGGSAGPGGAPMGGQGPAIGGGGAQAAAQAAVAPTPQQEAFFKQQAQNTQKLAVMKAADNAEDIYDLHNVATPASPYEVQAGTVIPATLITSINSSLAGSVVAQVRQSVFDTVKGKFLLIPKGSKLLGEYEARVATGQQRVLLTFSRIIRPDGSSILLGKPNSADLQGQAGLTGDVDNHWMRVIGTAVLATILSYGSGAVSDRYRDSSGNINTRQGGMIGVGQNISSTGQAFVNRSMEIQPTISIPPGTELNVIVKKDMVLTPYKS